MFDNLLELFEEVYERIEGQPVNVSNLDFAKAFDIVVGMLNENRKFDYWLQQQLLVLFHGKTITIIFLTYFSYENKENPRKLLILTCV